jgi:hypothetical protein
MIQEFEMIDRAASGVHKFTGFGGYGVAVGSQILCRDGFLHLRSGSGNRLPIVYRPATDDIYRPRFTHFGLENPLVLDDVTG